MEQEGPMILRPSAEGRMLRLLLPGFFLLVVLIAAVILSKLGLCCLVLCMLAGACPALRFERQA